MVDENRWGMQACELDVDLWGHKAGHVFHDRDPDKPVRDGDCEMSFDASERRLRITQRGQHANQSWTAEMQYIRWMAPREGRPGSPLLECTLDVDLRDYRPDHQDEVLVEKNFPIPDAQYSIMSMDDLVQITARKEPGREDFLPAPELHWLVPARHVRGPVPKPSRS